MKGKPQAQRKYSQYTCIYLTTGLYPACVKNSCNSVIKRETTPPTPKMGKIYEQTLPTATRPSMDVCFNCLLSLFGLLELAPVLVFFWPTILLSFSVHSPSWSLTEAIRPSCSSNTKSSQRWAHDPIKPGRGNSRTFFRTLGWTVFHPIRPELESCDPRAAGGQLDTPWKQLV